MRTAIGLLIFFCSQYSPTQANAQGKPSMHSKMASFRFIDQGLTISVPLKSEYEFGKDSGQIPTSVIQDFHAPNSVNDDIRKEMTGVPSETRLPPYDTQKFSWGTVYTWNTPTRGSAIFSYVCRDGDGFCFKIGPYSMVEIDWALVEFNNIEPTNEHPVGMDSFVGSWIDKRYFEELRDRKSPRKAAKLFVGTVSFDITKVGESYRWSFNDNFQRRIDKNTLHLSGEGHTQIAKGIKVVPFNNKVPPWSLGLSR